MGGSPGVVQCVGDRDRARLGDDYAGAEGKRQQIPQRYPALGRNCVVQWAVGIGEHFHVRQLGQEVVDRVIQAEGANPLVRAFTESDGETMHPVEAQTRATAIRIGNPASWRKAAKVIRDTGGWCLDVSEAEIAIAKAEIGAEGLGCEPASAVTLAGLKKLCLQGKVSPNDSVVLLLTGHTLKDADYTINFHRGSLLTESEAAGREKAIAGLERNAIVVEPTPDAVLATLKGITG